MNGKQIRVALRRAVETNMSDDDVTGNHGRKTYMIK